MGQQILKYYLVAFTCFHFHAPSNLECKMSLFVAVPWGSTKNLYRHNGTVMVQSDVSWNRTHFAKPLVSNPYIYLYLVGGLEHDFYEIPSNYWECHQPNWFIFFRGVSSNHQADISLRVPQGWPQIIHPVHVLEQFRQARGWKTEKTQWIPWEKKLETPGEKAKI